MSSPKDASTASLVPPSLIGFARLACGAAAGAITKTIIAPLERIKIIHQTQGMHIHAARAAAAAAAASGVVAASSAQPQQYTGILQTLRHILEKEGWRSLWNGNGANVIRVIPNYGLRFSFNDRARELVASFKKRNSSSASASASPHHIAAANAVPHLSKFDLFLAGSLAGIGQITITYPAEVIFTRLTISGSAVATTKYTGIIDCIARTLKQEGPRAFYNGYSATLLSGVPYVALQMSCYEIFQRSLAALVAENKNKSKSTKTAAFSPVDAATATDSNNQSVITASSISSSNDGSAPTPASSAAAAAAATAADRSVLVKLTAGAFAGLVAQTLTFPGDVVRKRMQSDGMGGKPKVYAGLWDACVKIAQREGFKGFFDGVKVNSWRCLPEGALMFVIFDGLKQGLKIDKHDAH